MTHLDDLDVKVTGLRNFVLKFFIKVFICLYLLNILMDQVDTLQGGRYWSKVSCCTITTHMDDLGQGHGLENFVLKFLVNMLMDKFDTLHVGRYWSEVLCRTITPE